MKSILPISLNEYWFMTSFILLMLMTPLLNYLINNYDKMRGIQDSLEQLNESASNQKGEDEEVVETLGAIVSAEGENKEKEQEPQGDATEGTTQGEATQGENTQGESTQGENTQGEATQGDATAAEGQGSEATETAGIEESDIYIVEKGDTLATISKKVYGDISHVEAICKMNGLEDGNLIFIGQKLLLP